MNILKEYYRTLVNYRFDEYNKDKLMLENEFGLKVLEELNKHQELKNYDYTINENYFNFIADYDYYDEPLNSLIQYKEKDWYGIYVHCDYIESIDKNTDVYVIFKFNLKENDKEQLFDLIDELNDNIQHNINDKIYNNLLDAYDKVLKDYFDKVYVQLIFSTENEDTKYININ